MTSCIFCEIAQGRAPASIVYADDSVLAFMDIQPVNPGHVLVVPRSHTRHLADLTGDTAVRLFQAGVQLASAVRRSGVRCEGVNLFLADGEAAGQVVPHVHLHVVPRFRGDGFGLRFGPSYGDRPERAALDAVAGRIRQALGG
jgi:histidine triad (HIT) family protein